MSHNGVKITTFCKVFKQFNSRTLRDWCATEQIPSYRVGHNWFVDIDKLVELHADNSRLSVIDLVSLHKGDIRLDVAPDLMYDEQ